MPVYAGCDYVRLTAPKDDAWNEWRNILLPEYVREERAGRRPHFRWLMGYYGQVGEHCFCGKGEQGSMVHASSSLAHFLFYPLSQAGGKATRVDLQITVSPPNGANDFLNEAYIMACAQPKARGNQTEIEMLDTKDGAKMVTIGRRSSEIYSRIYDKGKESKDPFYAGMVRLEIEVKGERARDLHSYLMRDKLLPFHAKHITTEWFRQKGVPVFWEQTEVETVPLRDKRTKTDATKLGWIASQVRPTIGKLLENGKELELASALLPDGASDEVLAELVACLRRVKGGYAG